MGMTQEQLLEKLNKKYPNSPITKLANEGDFVATAELAANMGVWGIWEFCREVAGLPFDEAARNAWLADYNAKRKASFSRK